MEAPLPEDFSNSITLKALKDNNQLSFQIKTKDNNFIISTELRKSILSKNYEGIFSLQDIQKNKYFLQFDSIKEIFEELVFKSQIQSPIIEKQNDNLILKIFLSSSKFKDIEFTLKSKIKSNEDKFKELYNILTEIKDENLELMQEINKLKQENFKFKEKINILIKSKRKKNNKKVKENSIQSNKILDNNNNKEEHIKWSVHLVDDDNNEEKSSSNSEKESLKTSSILNNTEEEINKFKKFLFPDISFDSELKYRMTRDGRSFKDFHKLCDNIAPNLLLIKDDKDNIFGGFTNVSWEDANLKKRDANSFLFSVTKNKKYFPKNIYNYHIFCISDSGPKYSTGNLSFQLGNMSLCMSSKKGDYLNESLSTNKAGEYFIVKEIEFYQILFN